MNLIFYVLLKNDEKWEGDGITSGKIVVSSSGYTKFESNTKSLSSIK